MKNKGKFLLAAIIGVTALFSVSCSEITIDSGFKDRINEVKQNVEELHKIGIINDAECKSYQDRYDKIAEKLTFVIENSETNLSMADDAINELKAYITRVYKLDSSEDVKYYNNDCSDSVDVYNTVTEQVLKKLNANGNKEFSGKITISGSGDGGNYTLGIEYLDINNKTGLGDSNSADHKDKDLEFNEYVIKDGVALSNYVEALQKYKTTGKLEDLIKDNIWQSKGSSTINLGEIFITTRSNGWIHGSSGVYNSYDIDYTVCQVVTLSTEIPIENSTKKKLVSVNVNLPLFDVRIYEPSIDIINMLTSGKPLGSGVTTSVTGDSKYIYKIDSSSNYMFNIEYPIQRLTSLTRDKGAVVCKYSTIDNLYFNIGSNCFMYDTYNNSSAQNKVRHRVEQNKLQIFVTGSPDLSKYSSDSYTTDFSHQNLNGLSAESLEVYQQGNNVSLLLVDYFETLYMGESIGEGNWIVTGRRLRLNTKQTGGGNLFAYVDYGNNVITGASGEPKTISYTTICSNGSVTVGTDIELLKSASDNTGTTNTDKDIDMRFSRYGTDNIFYKKYTTDRSEVKLSNVIAVGMSISENSIGASYTNDAILPIYCIKLISDVQSESLNTNWVMTDNKYNNIGTWLKWLDANGVKYSYTLKDIKDKSGYTYEFGQLISGYNTALDRVAIAEIQERIKEKDNTYISTMVKSFVVIVGYAIILWGALLIPAWIIDTNVYLGIEFYRILTLGTCRAVSIVDNKEKTKYRQIGMGELIFMVLSCIALGTSLIYVDYMKIIAKIVLVFSKLATGIEDVIINMR